MCLIYGFLATHPTRVDCALVRSQNALIRKRTGQSRNIDHATGWGCAVYRDNEPVVNRRVFTPDEKFVFDPEMARTSTCAAIAHTRLGSAGVPENKNAHPFTHQAWTYAQHGTVENFNAMRRELMGELNPEYRRSIAGTTDAEHAFYLYLSYLKRSAGSTGGDAPIHRIRDSFLKTINMLNEMTGRSGSRIRSCLNVLCTNRQVLLACRQGGSLFYVHRNRAAVCPICREFHVTIGEEESYGAVVLASEPLSGEDWQEVPDRSVVLVDPDLSVLIAPLDP